MATVVADYSGHAEMVLSGLRNAVDSADEQILKLQRELEELERKASDGEPGNTKTWLTTTSELSEDLNWKDCEDMTDDDQDALSLSSSTIGAVTSTKLFHESKRIYAHSSDESIASFVPNYGFDETSKSDGEDSSKVEKEVDERWGCLKRILSDDCSDESHARDKLFKQILQATEKKHVCNATKPNSGNNSATSNDTPGRKKRQGKQTGKESRHANNESACETTSAPPTARTGKSQKNSKALEETRAENERLQDRLRSEKEHSDTLCDKISDLEKDIEELQIQVELKAHENSTGKIAELVEEIQKAQKLRESAMLERIDIASRDRDDAIIRAKAMFLKNTLPNKDASPDKEKRDQTMMDLVDKISDADSASVIERCGHELLARMNNLKNARSRITEEEMAVVMRERDDAVAKCHNLEQELRKYVDKLSDAKKSQKISINNHLKDKVLSTEEECKKAHSRLYEAEEEIKNLKSSYKMFKSQAHSQDEELAKRYNDCLRKIQADAESNREKAKKLQRKNHLLMDKLNRASAEAHTVRKENDRLAEDYSKSQEKCGKLERLVKVLRKKLIAQAQHPISTHE